jgi:hypothetical protein
MPTLIGFNTFAALPEEEISEKISRRILSGDQGMLVWWSIEAGAHVEPHSHASEQIVWMLKGKMQRTAGLRPGRRCSHSGRCGARSMVPGRHGGDRFLCASAGGLPAGRQARLHERRLTITCFYRLANREFWHLGRTQVSPGGSLARGLCHPIPRQGGTGHCTYTFIWSKIHRERLR